MRKPAPTMGRLLFFGENKTARDLLRPFLFAALRRCYRDDKLFALEFHIGFGAAGTIYDYAGPRLCILAGLNHSIGDTKLNTKEILADGYLITVTVHCPRKCSGSISICKSARAFLVKEKGTDICFCSGKYERVVFVLTGNLAGDIPSSVLLREDFLNLIAGSHANYQCEGSGENCERFHEL